jgi:hypothetical protein
VNGVDVARLPARLRPLVRPIAPPALAPPAGHGALRGGLRRLLRRAVSDFDADGLLRTHRMVLLDEEGWRELLGAHPAGRLLDVGAGSGDVTVHARGLFADVVTTETSPPLRWRLQRRGLGPLALDLTVDPPPPGPFAAVALLNVLDRTDRPRTLLRRLLPLAPRLLLSVPLPVRPHVDRGGRTGDPDEPLTGRGSTFEAALADLVEGTLEPCGMVVSRLARTPYLSFGRAGAPPEALDAALVVGRGRPIEAA